MTPGLVLTATIYSNDIPNTMAFTYPASGAKLTNQTFNLAGTITSTVTNPSVTYQLFYGSNSVTPASTNVTITTNTPPAKTTWTTGLTNLAPGYYTVVATVEDAIGRTTLISESLGFGPGHPANKPRRGGRRLLQFSQLDRTIRIGRRAGDTHGQNQRRLGLCLLEQRHCHRH